jgi:putative transposase
MPNADLPIVAQCDLVGISRSTYYAQQMPAKISEEDELYMRLIDEEYTQHPFYGKRRMRIYLRNKGYRVGYRRVRRLMGLLMISGMAPGPKTSTPHPLHKVYPYLLRGVPIVRPNQVWSTDITYIRLEHGFVYLVAIIDWYSRKVLSFRVSNTLDAGFCVDCLEEAIRRYGTPEIFNTDQGVQFTSLVFTEILLSNQIKISMDGRGRVFDNIFTERLWRTLKYEDIYLKGYASVAELLIGLTAYFSFYNTERFHQALADRTPDEVYVSGKNGGALIIQKYPTAQNSEKGGEMLI